jgi:hypothetical protein
MQRRDQKKEPDHIGPGLGKRLAAYEDLNQDRFFIRLSQLTSLTASMHYDGLPVCP